MQLIANLDHSYLDSLPRKHIKQLNSFYEKKKKWFTQGSTAGKGKGQASDNCLDVLKIFVCPEQ